MVAVVSCTIKGVFQLKHWIHAFSLSSTPSSGYFPALFRYLELAFPCFLLSAYSRLCGINDTSLMFITWAHFTPPVAIMYT